jgi:hypothetical protein
MIESFLNEENKNKIKKILHDILWPIKVYSIIILIVLLLNVFYVYKMYILSKHLIVKNN